MKLALTASSFLLLGAAFVFWSTPADTEPAPPPADLVFPGEAVVFCPDPALLTEPRPDCEVVGEGYGLDMYRQEARHKFCRGCVDLAREGWELVAHGDCGNKCLFGAQPLETDQ